MQGGWPYLYPVVLEVTGKHVTGNGAYAATLCELAEQAGPEAVIEAIRAVGLAMAPIKPNLRAIAFGVEDAIRRPPKGRDLAVQIKAALDVREAEDKRVRQADAAVHRRRRAEQLAEAAAAVPEEAWEALKREVKSE